MEGKWQWRSLRSLALLFLLRRASGAVPCSLCSDSPWSSRPRPMRIGGDASPCKVVREEHELSFLKSPVAKCCRRVFFFFQLVRCIPERPGREPACVVDCGGFVVTTVVTGPNPQMQGPTGKVLAKCGHTHTLVDVPAALWDCWR